MKYVAMIIAAICLTTTGCQQFLPPQPAQPAQPVIQKEKIVIIDRKPAPPAPAPKSPQPQIRIDINAPKGACTHHNHCGKCDHCKRNGWVIEIRP